MATYTLFAETDSGTATSTSTTYTFAREGTGTKTFSTAATRETIGQRKNGTVFDINQAFFNFDTSGVPAGTPLENVKLTLNVTLDGVTALGENFGVDEEDWVASPNPFIAGTILSATPAYGTFSTGLDVIRVLTGPADVARSASYGVVVFGEDQRLGSATTEDERSYVYNSRHPTAANWPFLTIVMAFEADLAVTLGDIVSTALADADCEATAAIALEPLGTNLVGRNGSRGDLAIALEAFGLASDAAGSVGNAQPADRQISFSSNVATARTITLED